MFREIKYEKEIMPDADIVARLFSRALRSLPLEGNMKQTKLVQTIKQTIKSPQQKIILNKIHNETRALWGSY